MTVTPADQTVSSLVLGSRWRRATQFTLGHGWARTTAVVGICMLLLIAIAAPLITAYDPIAIDPTAALHSPSTTHPFGTDQLGRDVFSRTVYAARIDLMIGFFGVTIPLILGCGVGLVSGYVGGWLDIITGRIIDVVTAFPFLVLVIAIVAMLGPGLINLFIAISLVSWVSYARIVRGQTLMVKNSDYVVAGRSLGFGPLRLMGRHILPNVVAPAFVFASSDFVLNIIAGASLGFFGLGVPAPTPEWGVMIAEGRSFIIDAPWIVLFPGLAVIVVSFFFGLMGDVVADSVRRMGSEDVA